MRKPTKRSIPSDRHAVLKRTVRLELFILMCYTAAFFLAAFIVHTASLARERVWPVALIAPAVSSLLCGYLGGKLKKKNSPLYGLLACLPAIVILLVLSLFSGGFSPDLTALLTAVILLLCALLGGTLAGRQKPNTRRLLKGRRP